MLISAISPKQEVSLHIHYVFNIKMYKCGAVSFLHIMCKSNTGNAEEYDSPYELVTAALWSRQVLSFPVMTVSGFHLKGLSPGHIANFGS